MNYLIDWLIKLEERSGDSFPRFLAFIYGFSAACLVAGTAATLSLVGIAALVKCLWVRFC